MVAAVCKWLREGGIKYSKLVKMFVAACDRQECLSHLL